MQHLEDKNHGDIPQRSRNTDMDGFEIILLLLGLKHIARYKWALPNFIVSLGFRYLILFRTILIRKNKMYA